MKRNPYVLVQVIILLALNSCQPSNLLHKSSFTTCNGFQNTKSVLTIELKPDSTFKITSKSKKLPSKEYEGMRTENGFYKTVNDTTFLYSELLSRKLYLVDKKYLMDQSTFSMIRRNPKGKRAILKAGISYKLK